MASSENSLRPKNPLFLSTLDNDASALQEVGKAEESVQVFRRVVAAKLDVLGPDHLHTAKGPEFGRRDNGPVGESSIRYSRG